MLKAADVNRKQVRGGSHGRVEKDCRSRDPDGDPPFETLKEGAPTNRR
jgi:hypothetical protein